MFISALVVAAALSVSQVLAHGGVTSYKIGGKDPFTGLDVTLMIFEDTTYTGWSPYNDASSQTSIERPYSTSFTSHSF